MATTANSLPATRTRVALGLALMVVLALATRLPFLGHPAADYDEQLYSLIGQRLLAGELPYTGLWDRKPLGLFAIYAAAHGLLGPGALAYQLVALLACIAGGWLTFRLASRIVPAPGAAFAAALYPPLMAVYGSHSGQSEIFLTPLLAAMVLAVVRARECMELRSARHRYLVAMALGGLALQVKYSALPVCALLGVLALLDLRRRHLGWPGLAATAAAFALLGLAPTLAVAALYAANGSLDGFIFANFISIGQRGGLPLALTLPRQFSDIAPLAALAFAGIIRRRHLPAAPVWTLALGWLVAGVAALFLSSTVYPYYYAALVPAVILVALPLFAGRTGGWLLAAVLGWLLALCNPVHKWSEARAEQATLAEMAPAIPTPACLYVYDGPLVLYRLTGSPLPTRLIYPDHLNNALEAGALPLDPAAEVARILANQPGAIVTSPQPVTLRNHATERLVQQALAKDYHLVGTRPFQQRPLALWLRRMPANICANSISKSSKLRSY